MGSIRVMMLGPALDIMGDPVRKIPGFAFFEAPLDAEKLMEPVSPPPSLIVCATTPPGVTVQEIAQLLRGCYPDVPIYLLGNVAIRQDRKILIKNGFTDVFFMPLDRDLMVSKLKEQGALLGSVEKVYRNIRLIDVKPDTVLDFNTYLYMPANGKHLQYSSAGDALDADQVKRLKSHQVGSLSVPVEEMKAFYKYTAESLRSTAGDASLSETERSEKLEDSVRQVMLGLFSDQATSTEEGKRSVSEMQNIVRSYVTAGAKSGDGLYARVQAATARAGAYSHSANTSTLASLFAMALGFSPAEVEEVALAGLLHDLGLTTLPADLTQRDPSEWIQADRDLYQEHPERTISMIRDRKLVVPDGVHKIILQHHERFNGTGYPKGLAGEKICKSAQVLAIADELDERLTPKPGQPVPKARDVCLEMQRENGTSITTQVYNPKYLEVVVSLFNQSSAS